MNDSSSPADDKLDALLRDWSQDQSVDSADLKGLHRAIVSDVELPVVTRETGVRHAPAVVALCAIAASLVMAVLVGFRAQPIVSSTSNDVEARAKLVSLWKQTDQLFGSDLDWICDLDGEFLLGVGKHEGNSSANRVGVTLTVRVFDPVQQIWKDTWSGRVACRGGTPVDFASADKRSTGSIWVQSRPDGGFAVSHWLNWQDHPELSGPIETIVAPKQPQVIAEKMSDGQRIQIVQQVWGLDA